MVNSYITTDPYGMKYFFHGPNYLQRWLTWVGAGLGDDGIDAAATAAIVLRFGPLASHDPGQANQA
jgi:hypothetical protein